MAQGRVQEFTARHGANLAWCLATFVVPQRPLLEALARQAERQELSALSLASR